MTLSGARADLVVVDDPFAVHVPGVVSNRDPEHYDQPKHGWTCFHCGETFRTPGAAADHFGATPDAKPGCLIRVQFGKERGLQIALRAVELERDELAVRLTAARLGVDEAECVERFRAGRGIAS